MIAIDRLVATDRCVPETGGFLLGHEQFHALAQPPLVAFQR